MIRFMDLRLLIYFNGMKNKIMLAIVLFCGMIMSCSSKPDLKGLDERMDKWHKDVAEFKLEPYFGFMTNGFVFLGTAPGERWAKADFYDFAKPYFDKKSTWDFKVIDRHWYFAADGKTAWFEENLETWMEDCRGSGVLIFENNEWKIAHYNLTVLIENEKIKEFIELRKKEVAI